MCMQWLRLSPPLREPGYEARSMKCVTKNLHDHYGTMINSLQVIGSLSMAVTSMVC